MAASAAAPRLDADRELRRAEESAHARRTVALLRLMLKACSGVEVGYVRESSKLRVSAF